MDEVLKSLGSRYQRWALALVALPANLPVAFVTFNVAFILATPNFHCAQGSDRCLANISLDNSSLVPCTEWVYDTDVYSRTLVMEVSVFFSTLTDGWLRHTSRAFQIAVSSQVKFDEICPDPSLILMFVPSCSIMLIPAPPLLRVWKNKLITKLYKHFKIDGKAITLINDSLKNIYIRVKYNVTLSKTFKLYQGLPQLSVLSPTLFTLFIAGIEEKNSHKTNIGLFADDIILWSSNTNWKKAERDLNKTLSHLEKFSNKHKLEFNPQKSET
ncbi:hypothetical protein LAZ67_18000788 [Cordylochernes scorpioides]|uniref:Reverse transcriptase domain-containing protein n=1 Tax=Cordylochernes scorpioides TaxID=51811 RepID=A0ABY6LJD1_9ARAC|nr:hypothetical protein LAZ67_18000788 [Cordylochernes scorpioides]